MDRGLTVALRCDGDERVGAGHVGRCLPIALALRRVGHDVFVGSYGGVAERLLVGGERDAVADHVDDLAHSLNGSSSRRSAPPPRPTGYARGRPASVLSSIAVLRKPTVTSAPTIRGPDVGRHIDDETRRPTGPGRPAGVPAASRRRGVARGRRPAAGAA